MVQGSQMAERTGVGSAAEGKVGRLRSRLGRLLREPVFHFVLLGILLLVGQRWLVSDRGGGEIIVSDAVVAGLRADLLRRTGRLPTSNEEEAWIQNYVDDEVLYREALALGLDRGDIIVRRRLMQKMAFLLEDAEPIPNPTDEELGRFLAQGADRYRVSDRFSLRHVFVSSERHGEKAEETARRLRVQLLSGSDPADVGDPFLRGGEFSSRSRSDLASIFGDSFAQGVTELQPNEWSEPIRSSFGYHLVLTFERQPARLPALDEVRDGVLRDWRKRQRDEANQRARAELRGRYEVRLPVAPGDDQAASP
jgi:peptidyl-prolyl cis-trans isomerase C